jgi:hypothetical protein
MNTVYVLYVEVPYEGFQVLGIYSSQQNAESARLQPMCKIKAKDYVGYEPERGFNMFIYEHLIDNWVV